ncbi:hypothetical protein COY45_02175 [Candidatus Berkelbacteria bacterium CG_4_10_14_0_8_um_filter_42_34]|uniref:Uncharacterized protein n=2 Tax=Candidatus Berkelbacteria TaxID=1618330 RepID=A0A2M7K1U6_9BACT|nr:MAG: hypothetical protein COZ63_00820 [Candidatus Berkelbacteria bacterium CG_4_8_14_3_um_filter_42_13]PIZ27500.1 MAG: hypothetical protein COY45_02175 [Candidatus Berkelbacteria bacterium CG_4_10_14_0_8_um_filter_42_34]
MFSSQDPSKIILSALFQLRNNYSIILLALAKFLGALFSFPPSAKGKALATCLPAGRSSKF